MTAQTQRKLRLFHHYIGVFLAPAILLFAFSGAFQTFRLNEESGWGGTPPGWMVWLADVHKDQAIHKPQPQDKAQEAGPPRVADPAKDAARATRKNAASPLKVFVGLMGIGLIISTLLGVFIALNNRAMRRVSIVMLVAGTALPLLLLG